MSIISDHFKGRKMHGKIRNDNPGVQDAHRSPAQVSRVVV
jgi:hypothetical protein